MLPFDVDALFATFAQQNRALWPAPAVVLMLGLGTIVLAVRSPPWGAKVIGTVVAAGWLWVAIGWHVLVFAWLNFMAPLYGAAFMGEGVLLAWATWRGRLAFRFRRDPCGWVGLALAVVAVVGYPLADRFAGLDWAAARVAGLTPCPTALLTMGLLLLTEGRKPLLLMLIPVLWTLVAGASGWKLAIPQDTVLPLAGIAAVRTGGQPARSGVTDGQDLGEPRSEDGGGLADDPLPRLRCGPDRPRLAPDHGLVADRGRAVPPMRRALPRGVRRPARPLGPAPPTSGARLGRGSRLSATTAAP